MNINLKTALSRHLLAQALSLQRIVLALVFLGLPGVLSAQTLLHRYSFDTNADDSVGGPEWNGTVVPPNSGGGGAPAIINNGLILAGGGSGGYSGYVTLPAGILTNTASITVECWVTENDAQQWATVWDFANNNNQNFEMCPFPQRGINNLDVAIEPNGNLPNQGEIDTVTGNLFPSGTEQYDTFTFNSNTLIGEIYTNGILAATQAYPSADYIPGAIGGASGTLVNALGNDIFGDAQFQGTIYELRIWNGVVSQRYLSASAILPSSVLVTNLKPTLVSINAGSTAVLTGAWQADVTVQLEQTGDTNLEAIADATNWVSGNTNVLTVNSSGYITVVGLGSTTISATVDGVTGASSTITVGPQTLLHRYSFVADASDSVGGSNYDGTLESPNGGTNATIDNGLFLPGGGSQNYSGYVELPPGILTNTTSLTIECWATETTPNGWAEIWSFNNGTSQYTGFIPDPQNNNHNMSYSVRNGVEFDAFSNDPFPTNSEQYIVTTFNAATLVGDLYTNGALIASVTAPNNSYVPGTYGGSAGTLYNYLGQDPFGGDPQWQGAIYEFRIWNGEVSQLYLSASASAGPTVVITNTTPLSLSVTVPTNSIVGAQTEQAAATANFVQVANVVVTAAVTNWTSSDTNILTVSSSGLITGISGGSATVSATAGGVTGTSPSITVALTKPQITTEPSPEFVVVDESGALTVVALGGDLTYQWFYGTNLIQGATGATLNLSNLNYGQSGNYSVVVSNGLGAVTSIVVALTVETSILEHRYSFVSDASDSVGGPAWNGIIVPPNSGGGGAPVTINNGLFLAGGGGGGYSGYVALPGGILTNTSSISVECWVTQNDQQQWATVWDFAVNDSENFELCPFPQRGILNLDAAIEPNGNLPNEGEVDTITGTQFPSGSEQYVTFTFDAATLTGAIYTNGVIDATQAYPSTAYIPGTIGGANGTTENALGNDVFGDAQFQGAIYEFRIWNGVVPQRYLSASAISGSSVVISNLVPTSTSINPGSSIVLTGIEQADVTVQLAQTGDTNLEATADATNWVSGNTNILTVSSSGVIGAVGLGSTTISATVGGVTGTSSVITVGPQTLLHRYSFVDDASDSVGGPAWVGTLQAPNGGMNATIDHGLILPGGGGPGYSGYVSLPAGILTATSGLTVECWATEKTPNGWAEIWSFNNGTPQYTAFIPDPDNNGHNMVYALRTDNNEDDASSNDAFPTNSEQYIVTTFYATTLEGKLYTNGTLIASVTTPNDSYIPGTYGGAAGTQNNYLGQDPWPDPQFQGTIHEFRIWNGAVSPLYLAASAVAGPTVVVTNSTPQSLSVTVPTNSIVDSQTMQATATANFIQVGDVPVTGAVTNWTSSDTNVLTVSSTGLVTGIANGAATVSATADGVTGTSTTITVTSVTLGISTSSTNVVLTWKAGVLLSAPTLLGPWTTNTSAMSPYTVAPTNGVSEFYKVEINP